MDQPIRMKNNGQISIVLNAQSRKAVSKEVPETHVLPKDAVPEHTALKEIERELGTLVGMEEMKRMIKEIYAWIYVNKKREEIGLKAGKQALHMMFKGNPGTGKTTVARLIGKLFLKMNVLSKGHLIEAERADLVGEYIGHTAQKTRDLIKKAMGGILFIDEAYSLGRGGEKDFGKEAIDTLVKHMEDKQHEFILILAGYSREMDYFLTLNPGLHSRFPLVIDFPDYNIEQLMEIADRMLKERDYSLSHEAEKRVREHLQITKTTISPKAFSNGRYIRNIIEKSIRAQAMRLLMQNSFDRHELVTIRSNDLIFDGG
ncbi:MULTISPECIES: stage V sporulation protein K [unclassified Bacillus (in: firmicutes)]|uniref:stage V sporulation protein K n=1 Tax=unclassified Bacillus (in: firmicutes) TaxID=185979 RepID=UPI0008EE311E|nr:MULTISPECIES: stage V sporulation protein K [unclassified Bacillus (in: firmicutes)]SFA72734.1 stage V sporulation protein K [Bacillus sp. UNCCL13]SFQ62860.1 stage V sporulation protein K [Bacillus sp. cl95]